MSTDRLMTYEEASDYLGVHPTRLSEYASYGLLMRHYSRDANGRRRVYFSEDEVLALDEKYPAGPDGRRRIRCHDLVSPCISRRYLSNGEVRYVLSMTVDGKTINKTYKSKQTAEMARERNRAASTVLVMPKRSTPAAPPAVSTNGSSTGLFRKIVGRMNRTPWAGEA
jgi:hypothetical protein